MDLNFMTVIFENLTFFATALKWLKLFVTVIFKYFNINKYR